MGDEEKEKKSSRSRSKSRERPSNGSSTRSRSKSKERKPTSSEEEGSVDDVDRREVRRGRKKGESGDKESSGKTSSTSRDKSRERGDRRGRSVERTKSSEPIVTLDKNGFPVTLDTKETAERRRRNRSSSRDGPSTRRSVSRDGPRDGRDLTDQDLSAIKQRSRSSSRERGIGRNKSSSEKDKTTKLSSRGRKKPSDLSVCSSHSRNSRFVETSKTNSTKGNNTLEMLLSMPKDDNLEGGGTSVAESRGARTSASSGSHVKKKKSSSRRSGDDDGNMSVMSFEPIDEEWGEGVKAKKKSSKKKSSS
ncbi:hypothetical protein IV203_010667 [Nitzschia inconspicua]|uniref:Uncharacterized protein n=1 Tax=Nitzschia inconspicua TaxID=303405 RepID=A0A9K3KXL1_9STRA|nr:hypothetical protein IV203_010667 [Nitzschia inconspicua]